MEPTKDNTTGTAEFDDFEDKDPDDCYCESGDVARKGVVTKVDNFNFDVLYHGTTKELPMTLVTDREFFLTQSIGMASIFCGRPTDEDIRNLKKQFKVVSPMINRQYKEWNNPKTLASKEPLKSITVIIEGAPEIDKPIHMAKSGFIYVLKLTPDYKDLLHKSSAMGPNEYFIPAGNEIKFSEKIPVTLDVTIIGRPRPQSWGPLTNPNKYDTEVNQMSESYTPLSEFDHYFQEGLFQNIFSKEKRAEKFINKGITKLLPAFMNDLDKINTAYNSMKYNRRLIMRMYYPRTVYTTQTVYDTHYGPNGSIYTIPRTVTTSHQEPTPEMIRLNGVAYFFKRITKKAHIMDMVNCPDTVYGALNASGNMYKEIYVVFGSRNVNDALAKLYATTLELSNHVNAFIGVLSAKSDAANVCDAIDVNVVDPDLPDIELPPLEENDPDLIQESMSAKERNALKNSDFAYIKRDSKGKVVERKYPINNEAHVKSAAHLFPRGIPDDPEIRKKVANKILRKAHSYGMDTSGWTSLNKAAGKTVKEGYEETMVEDLYQESASKRFRAQYKDPAYFDKFIANEEESIKRFKGAGKEDKNSIIAGKYLKLISAKYSNGESKKVIKTDVDDMFKYVKDVSSYNDMVDYLSLAILFDIDRKKIYNVMKCDKYDDVFITGLKKYVDKKDHAVTYAGLKYPKQYETFNKALNGEINGDELNKYINSRWYPSCKGRAFYDDHKSKTDTYCGYWCWVGGAVAKIKSMNKDMTSKYTPTDLI